MSDITVKMPQCPRCNNVEGLTGSGVIGQSMVWYCNRCGNQWQEYPAAHPTQPSADAPQAVDGVLSKAGKCLVEELRYLRGPDHTAACGVAAVKLIEELVHCITVEQTKNDNLRAALGAGTGSGWRDIATAPLGTDILLWCEGSRYEDRGVKVGQMTTLTGRRVPLIGATLYTTSGDAFTLWQPLPATPSAQTPAGTEG